MGSWEGHDIQLRVEGGQSETLLPLGLGQNLTQCGIVGNSTVLCGMVQSQSWSLGSWGGAKDALEASGKRSQNTQRDSFTFSFLTALSPHTVDYCLSYKLFKRRWHGHGLATQWTNHLAF